MRGLKLLNLRKCVVFVINVNAYGSFEFMHASHLNPEYIIVLGHVSPWLSMICPSFKANKQI